MRLITWNCCWKVEQKLTALLAEAPDVAVIQECSKAALDKLPDGYRGLWLGGAVNHGLGLICREPWTATNVLAAEQPLFVRVDIAGPRPFRLIAAWNCPPKGTTYLANLRNFFIAHEDWLDSPDTVLAGDLNSQEGCSLDRGRYRHRNLEEGLRAKGLVDTYAAVRGSQSLQTREPTHHHQWKLDKPFHVDYIFAPEAWLPSICSITIGAPAFWSRLSDHSPVTLSLCDEEAPNFRKDTVRP